MFEDSYIPYILHIVKKLLKNHTDLEILIKNSKILLGIPKILCIGFVKKFERHGKCYKMSFKDSKILLEILNILKLLLQSEANLKIVQRDSIIWKILLNNLLKLQMDLKIIIKKQFWRFKYPSRYAIDSFLIPNKLKKISKWSYKNSKILQRPFKDMKILLEILNIWRFFYKF